MYKVTSYAQLPLHMQYAPHLTTETSLFHSRTFFNIGNGTVLFYCTEEVVQNSLGHTIFSAAYYPHASIYLASGNPAQLFMYYINLIQIVNWNLALFLFPPSLPPNILIQLYHKISTYLKVLVLKNHNKCHKIILLIIDFQLLHTHWNSEWRIEFFKTQVNPKF